MEVDTSAGVFRLTDKDIALLGEPAFSHAEPLSRGAEIYHRAESRAAMNISRGLDVPRPGSERNTLMTEINSVNICMAGIMGITEPYINVQTNPRLNVREVMDEWVRMLEDEE